ncbi:MAG TPA: tRNA lysidine(34) synthetase TilS [Nocardioidaceae bacterium]|nr:tRNA lysidine(34) synthetase TilS [Nocardioidaceae bacterium]
MGPHPAVAAVRHAVRRGLADLPPRSTVLVACSGGADSLALAVAVGFEARTAAWRAGAVVVDHNLQPGSAEVAARTAGLLRDRGLDPVDVVGAQVGAGIVGGGIAGAGGPEAAARAARYEALAAVADRHGADAVLLGHTRDDQAETVLLGLARGSGARSLAGMAPRSGRYRRPLLDVDRAQTRAACAAEGLTPWDDPHNTDSAYTRVRVRAAVLPVLERELGPGVAGALARTARLLRADADALDDLAATALTGCRTATGLDVPALQALSSAVRARVLRSAALMAGCPATELFARHVEAVDALVTQWRGQRWVDLPGGVRARRERDELQILGAAVAG